ncbi:MAG: Uma2 family endonuclease [Chloroflexota bacterium]
MGNVEYDFVGGSLLETVCRAAVRADQRQANCFAPDDRRRGLGSSGGGRLGTLPFRQEDAHGTGADGAYALSTNCLRVPDVGFYTMAKAARINDPHKFLPFAPDLAVEVVAPNESAAELMQKVTQYLAAGTTLVWVVYPELRIVVVHSPNSTARTFTSAGVLDGGTLLPSLQITVSDLFPNSEETI